MTPNAESILNQALALSEEERTEVAERLLGTVAWSDEEADLTEEQKAMLDRRWKEIDSGKAECRPVDELLEEMRAKYGL